MAEYFVLSSTLIDPALPHSKYFVPRSGPSETNDYVILKNKKMKSKLQCCKCKATCWVGPEGPRDVTLWYDSEVNEFCSHEDFEIIDDEVEAE